MIVESEMAGGVDSARQAWSGTGPGTVPGIAPGRLLIVVALFWAFTYVLLSWRTEMLVGDGFRMFSDRRVIGTSVGAMIFWCLLEWIGTMKTRPHPVAVLVAIVPATLLVLATRLATDRVLYAQPLDLDLQVRWALAWAGYFGLWVGGYLALSFHRAMEEPVEVVVQPPRTTASPAPVALPWNTVDAYRAAPPEPASEAAWTWAVDALSEELAATPGIDAPALVERLVERAGYEAAPGTELDPAHYARIELALRLAARLTNRRRRPANDMP